MRMTMNRRTLLAAALWALAACTSAPTTLTTAPPGAVLPQKENLVAQGIRPIAQSPVERIAKDIDVRSHRFFGWRSALRFFIERAAPLNNAAQIRKPRFVLQGQSDRRVAYTESEQMLAKARAAGQPL
jgi:alpha-beta hydrolase superfamily lysophospholipase